MTTQGSLMPVVEVFLDLFGNGPGGVEGILGVSIHLCRTAPDSHSS